MKISAQQSATINKIETAIKNADPVFYNYKDGTFAFQVKDDVSNVEIEGMKLISCNPHNGGFVAKYR